MTIGIEHVNDYPLIRFEIRFERKFPIRRSLVSIDIFAFSCVHMQCLWRLHYIVVAYNIIFDSVSIVCCTSIFIHFAFHRRWSCLFYPWKFGPAFSSPAISTHAIWSRAFQSAFSTPVLFMVPCFPFPHFHCPQSHTILPFTILSEAMQFIFTGRMP